MTSTAGLLVAYLRLVSTAPRGFGRALAAWWHWVADDHRYAESREDLHLTGKGDPVAIQEGHQARQRSHLLLSLVGLIVATVAGVWHFRVEALAGAAPSPSASPSWPERWASPAVPPTHDR